MSHPSLPQLTNQQILIIPNTSQSINPGRILEGHRDISKLSQSGKRQCRTCLQTSDVGENPLMSTCLCSGSLKYVHRQCLQEWLLRQYEQSDNSADFREKNEHYCQICQSPYMVDFSLKLTCANFSTFLPKIRANRCVAAINIIFVMADILCLVFSCYYALQDSKKQELDVRQAKYFLVYVAILLAFISTIYGVYQFVRVFMMEEKIVVNERGKQEENGKRCEQQVRLSIKDRVENKDSIAN